MPISMRIELVYDLECPNVNRARDALRSALRAADLPEAWQEWQRGVSETPAALRELGSPSVLVNGRDVADDAIGHSGVTTSANSCRIYADECGCIGGAPSVELILHAIHHASAFKQRYIE